MSKLRIFAAYSILICLISLTVRAAEQPEGRWTGIINCNHERNPFVLEIHDGNVGMSFHNYLYQGLVLYGDKSLRLTISAKRSDGINFDENLYFSANGKHLTGNVKENCQISAFNKQPFQSSMKTAKDLTYENQLKLSWLGYYRKALDGISGPATLSALSNFYSDKKISNKNIDPTISHEALNNAFNKEIDKAKWLIQDDFEKLSPKNYQREQYLKDSIKRGKAGLIDIDGNSAVFVNSGPDELDVGSSEKYIKDRIELGVKLDDDLSGQTIWYGFKVRYPAGKNDINAESITISQMKQMHYKDAADYQTSRNKQSCNGQNGLFWRLNMQKGNKLGMWSNLEKTKTEKIWIPNALHDKNWTSFKVGIHYTTGNHGWIKAVTSNRTVFSYKGRTILNQYIACIPNSISNRLRIGAYRGFERGQNLSEFNKGDMLIFDNFIIHWDEAEIDKFLN